MTTTAERPAAADHPAAAAAVAATATITDLLTGLGARHTVDVAAVLATAVASAAANVGGADILLNGSPPSTATDLIGALAALGTDPALPLARRTAPVVLYLDGPDQYLADMGLRALWECDRDDIRTELETPDLTEHRRTQLWGELAAVDALYTRDNDTYLTAWLTSATARARELGLPPDVPVTVSTEMGDFFDDGDLEPLYDAAAAAVLPRTDRDDMTATPGVFVDADEFVDTERAARRSYRDRVGNRRRRPTARQERSA